jgi:hypothetical protein
MYYLGQSGYFTILLMEILDGYDEVGRRGYTVVPVILSQPVLISGISCVSWHMNFWSIDAEVWLGCGGVLVVTSLYVVAHVFAMMVAVWVLVFRSLEVELFDKIRVLLLSGGFGCIYGGRDLVSRRRDLCTWCSEVQMEKVKSF